MSIKSTENDEISLKELFEKSKEWYSYLLTKWKIILLCAIIGSILGLCYSFTQKTIYTASLSFALEDEKAGGGIGGALGIANSLGLDLGGNGGSVFASANLSELLKSRSMVEKTLLTPVNVNGEIISLAEMYIQDNEWRDDWKDNPKLKNIQFLPNSSRKDFTRVHDSILGVMYKSFSKGGLIVGMKDKKSAITTIDVASTDELFSKYFVEALAEQVLNFYVATKSKKARLNMAILEKQTDSIRGELNGAITGVAVANDNTFNLNPALNVKRAPSARRQVDVQANTAILTELIKQLELAKVTLRKETPLFQVIDTPILPLEKQGFGKIKGIILGGFLFGFFATMIIVLKRILNNL